MYFVRWRCLLKSQPLWNNKLRLVGFCAIFVRYYNLVGQNTNLRSDVILDGRRSARSQQCDSVVWREGNARCWLGRGEMTVVTMDWNYRRKYLASPPPTSPVSTLVDQTEGLTLWLHFTTWGMLRFSSGSSAGICYKSHGSWWWWGQSLFHLHPGSVECRQSPGTIILEYSSAVLGLGCPSRPGTSLHNAVLILNNVASRAFSQDPRLQATTLNPLLSGGYFYCYCIFFCQLLRIIRAENLGQLLVFNVSTKPRNFPGKTFEERKIFVKTEF